MKTRFIALLMIIVLALALVPAVSAQEAGCFGLSADDCAIINGASANTANITSFNQDFSINFSATGLGSLAAFAPGVPAEITFEVSGVGPFAFAEGDVPFALSLPMSGSFSMGETTEFEMPFALVDGVLYLQTSELVGIPLTPEMINDLIASSGAGSMGLNADSLMGAGAMAGSGDMMAGMESLAQYINYVRLADEDMMGQTMYPFEFSFDLGALLASEDFASMMGMLGGMAGDNAQIAQDLAMVGPLLQGIESSLVITQWVGADDNFIHGLSVEMYATLDLSALMGAEPGSMDPIEVSFEFNVAVSDINSDLAIAAPEGARILSEEEVQGMMGSGSGQ